ncbi:Rrf2 family transcriptional regulator [Chitinophaga sp. NPDC101104]|uniref:Rrf2 family transcriptional regulator n=1 Tax=Chitinophaga sp. NPDC101104 TaxID=3390561 RepID=UPI003D0285EA
MIRSKFAIHVHILSLMGKFHGEWLTSDLIAGSLNSNAALVRKELSELRNAGLIESKEGKNGGCRLAKPMKDILLSDVFAVVKDDHIFGYAPNHPNPDCPVGRNINNALDTMFTGLDQSITRELSKISLADFISKLL